jgi:ribosomal protein S18 acetylase RimI-like enzyme
MLYHGDIGPNFKRTFEAYVRDDACVVLIAERSSKVVGILVGSFHADMDWEGKIAKIDALIVHSDFRKTGIGRRLMLHFIKKTQRKGCKAVTSRINRRNNVAQVFHKALGFSEAYTYEYVLDLQETT